MGEWVGEAFLVTAIPSVDKAFLSLRKFVRKVAAFFYIIISINTFLFQKNVVSYRMIDI